MKVRDRHASLWAHLGVAIRIADVSAVLDNSSARAPFRPCASFEQGVIIGSPGWPWTLHLQPEARLNNGLSALTRVIHKRHDAGLRGVLPLQNHRMGIRYYAYAFDKDQNDEALAEPLAVIAADPLADALGLEPGFTLGVTNFRQSLPQHLLYLDKAWQYLQRLTAPRSSAAEARAAYQMFEGQVTFGDNGCSWRPWVRAIPPHKVALIARDLETISDHDIEAGLRGFCSSPEVLESKLAYTTQFLDQAKGFVHTVASEGRGFTYMIG